MQTDQLRPCEYYHPNNEAGTCSWHPYLTNVILKTSDDNDCKTINGVISLTTFHSGEIVAICRVRHTLKALYYHHDEHSHDGFIEGLESSVLRNLKHSFEPNCTLNIQQQSTTNEDLQFSVVAYLIATSDIYPNQYLTINYIATGISFNPEHFNRQMLLSSSSTSSDFTFGNEQQQQQEQISMENDDTAISSVSSDTNTDSQTQSPLCSKGPRRRQQHVSFSDQITVHEYLIDESELPKLYCFCRRPSLGKLLVGCDSCDEWYHCDCVGLKKEEVANLESYICDRCRKQANESTSTTAVISHESVAIPDSQITPKTTNTATKTRTTKTTTRKRTQKQVSESDSKKQKIPTERKSMKRRRISKVTPNQTKEKKRS